MAIKFIYLYMCVCSSLGTTTRLTASQYLLNIRVWCLKPPLFQSFNTALHLPKTNQQVGVDMAWHACIRHTASVVTSMRHTILTGFLFVLCALFIVIPVFVVLNSFTVE